MLVPTRLLILFLLPLLFLACGDAAPAIAEASAETVTPVADVEATFGEEFTDDKVLPAGELTESFTVDQLADTVTVTLSGKVDAVCQMKGCWMTIPTGEADEMMVKFKDYGFFMPKDISGREVVMHGMAYYQVTPVEELQHYAEDAGKSAEEIAAITEPKRELRFLADGVRLISVN